MTDRELRRMRRKIKEKEKNFAIAKLRYKDCESCYHHEHKSIHKWCMYFVKRPKKYTCDSWTHERDTWSSSRRRR